MGWWASKTRFLFEPLRTYRPERERYFFVILPPISYVGTLELVNALLSFLFASFFWLKKHVSMKLLMWPNLAVKVKWEPPNAWKMCPHDKGKTVSVPMPTWWRSRNRTKGYTGKMRRSLSRRLTSFWWELWKIKKKERRHERRPFCKFVEPGLAELRAPPPYRYHTHTQYSTFSPLGDGFSSFFSFFLCSSLIPRADSSFSPMRSS